jgi:ribosomal protein S25
MNGQMTGKNLTREFIAERDLKMFRMRQAGASHSEIAKRYEISVSVVSKGISRVLERLNRDAALAYPEVLRLELERLDNLQSSVWPLTQFRRETIGDEEIVVEPDMKAIQTVLGIMDRRARLLGMEVQRVDLNVGGTADIRHSLAGEALKDGGKIDYRAESMQLLELMQKAGVLEAGVVEKVLAEVEDEGVVDAELLPNTNDGEDDE